MLLVLTNQVREDVPFQTNFLIPQLSIITAWPLILMSLIDPVGIWGPLLFKPPHIIMKMLRFLWIQHIQPVVGKKNSATY